MTIDPASVLALDECGPDAGQVDADGPELCFYHLSSPPPSIQAADPRRNWMDETWDRYAYRCLPLAIANAHGWHILSPLGFVATWNGGDAPKDVSVIPDPGQDLSAVPTGHFGSGTLTFHVGGLVRTPPGWNLWVGGPPNEPKDAIAPLSGVVETDWAPVSFTMNWRFTRPGQTIRFEKGEPFCFFFPIKRGSVEQFSPIMTHISVNPNLNKLYEDWRASRDAHGSLRYANTFKSKSETWQKHYFKGTDISGCRHIEDHQTKLHVPEFAMIEDSHPSSPLAPIVQATSTGKPEGTSGRAEEREAEDSNNPALLIVQIPPFIR